MKVYPNNNSVIIICSFLIYCTLIIGFFLNENLTTGAYWDYLETKNIAARFITDFENTFFEYDRFHTRHSPMFVIFISKLSEFMMNDYVVRFFYLHLNLSLPIFFFLCLKEKFKEIDNNIFFLFSLIILISPTFRSLAIWPDSRNLGLSTFILSIYFYLKFVNKKKNYFCYLNIVTYAFSSYISPNFSVLSLFFIYKYFRYFGLSKYFFYIIILNTILALPAFYYLFILKINFLFKSAITGGNVDFKIWFNYVNKIFCISTILFFYLIPFYYSKLISFNILEQLKFKYSNILIIIFFIIGLFIFNYEFNFAGGGIFFQLSNIIFGNLIFFYITVFISLLVLNDLLKSNKDNIIIYFLIILSNVQETIYHKYYDPLMIILYLILFDIKINQVKFNKRTIIIFFIFYVFLMFLYYIKKII